MANKNVEQVKQVEKQATFKCIYPNSLFSFKPKSGELLNFHCKEKFIIDFKNDYDKELFEFLKNNRNFILEKNV